MPCGISAWHNDTFVSGPSWAEFSRRCRLADPRTQPASSTSLASISPCPVIASSSDVAERPGPSSKIQTGNVVLQHLEGGDWTFATITRYNSWQDFATERAAAASAGDATAGGWADSASIPRFIATRSPIGSSRQVGDGTSWRSEAVGIFDALLAGVRHSFSARRATRPSARQPVRPVQHHLQGRRRGGPAVC